MDANILQLCDKARWHRYLGRQYLRGMVDSKQVRRALAKLRTDANMTPEEFADAAGVNRATVYRIEDAADEKYSPRIETVSALVGGLDLTLSDFFARIEGLTPTRQSDLGSASPDPKAVDDGRSLSAAERSADTFVRLEFIETLAQQFVSTVDRLIASRAKSGSHSTPKPARRRRASSSR